MVSRNSLNDSTLYINIKWQTSWGWAGPSSAPTGDKVYFIWTLFFAWLAKRLLWLVHIWYTSWAKKNWFVGDYQLIEAKSLNEANFDKKIIWDKTGLRGIKTDLGKVWKYFLGLLVEQKKVTFEDNAFPWLKSTIPVGRLVGRSAGGWRNQN